MPSFDIVSKIDEQSLDNAINVARKEIVNRFDFHGSQTSITLDKKTMLITIVTENEMRLNSVSDVIRSRMVKQRLDPRCLDMGKDQYASGNMIRKEIKIKQGIDRDTAKKIISDIKNSKLKVQPQVMDDQVRVSGKKIDDLQQVIGICSKGDYGLPLQYVNMK